MPAFLHILVSIPLALTAYETVTIEEWDVPWLGTRPRDPFVAVDGTIWFVGQVGHYAASFDLQTEEFTRYDLPDGSGPHNLIVDSLGIVWYAGNLQSHIGELDPSDGSIRQIAMPRPAARDPHTLVFDQAGDIWFTVQNGNFVGLLDVETSEVSLIPSLTFGSRPYGIVINSKGEPWVALFGTNKLAHVDPETMEITEVVLPRDGARPRRLQVTSDDRVWYVDHREGYLGVYDPVSDSIKEWLMPSGGGARPYGMAVDAADRLWFVETGVQPNQFIGFDSSTETFLPGASVPSGGRTIRHMYYHEPENEVWFGTDASTIGRAKLPETAVGADTETVPTGLSVGSPYPNPTLDRLRVPVGADEPSTARLVVMDVAGRVVSTSRSEVFGTRNFDLDLSTLSSGVYFLQVRLGNETSSRRISVVR